MKLVLTESQVPIPDNVTVTIHHKKVQVEGPRGSLERDFAPALLEMEVTGNSVVVRCWQGDRKQRAMVSSVCSHIKNMVNGVIAGYEAEIRAVFAHFPFMQDIDQDKQGVNLRNYMGKRDSEHIRFPPGVTYEVSDVSRHGTVQSTILRGNSLEQVTGSAAALRRFKPKDKDPVKFRDGLYRKSLKYIDKEILGREAPERYS